MKAESFQRQSLPWIWVALQIWSILTHWSFLVMTYLAHNSPVRYRTREYNVESLFILFDLHQVSSHSPHQVYIHRLSQCTCWVVIYYSEHVHVATYTILTCKGTCTTFICTVPDSCACMCSPHLHSPYWLYVHSPHMFGSNLFSCKTHGQMCLLVMNMGIVTADQGSSTSSLSEACEAYNTLHLFTMYAGIWRSYSHSWSFRCNFRYGRYGRFLFLVAVL